MRILYHHRTLADGAEGIHIRSMVAAFEELGHDVRLVGANPTVAPAPRRNWKSAARATLPPPLFEFASMALNTAERVPLEATFADFAPQLLYKRHARFDTAALQTARRHGVRSVLEVNCVFTARDYERFEPMTFLRLARRYERRSFGLASVVLAVSTPLAAQVESLAHVRPLVIPNGADPAVFDPALGRREQIRAHYGLGEHVTAGWTGILRDWHGLELLLRAVVLAGIPKLLIVGDGPARAALEDGIVASGLKGRVVITGRVAHDRVRDYIAAMDIAVVADERTGIASPMKLLEYMAMARAVVAPRTASITDLICEERNGLLFTPGDPAALAEALRVLAHDRERRQRLGASARQLVSAERNWLAIARRAVEAATL